MVSIEYALFDESEGLQAAALPLTLSGPIPSRLNDIGTFTATMPLTHPAASDLVLNTRGFSQDSDRELVVLRDDVPVWDGKLIGAQASERAGTVTLSFAEGSWWTKKRVLEVNKTYDGIVLSNDVNDILRDVGDYMTGKTSDGTVGGGTDIHAALPRFTIEPTSGLAGVTKNLTYLGTDRKSWADIIADIIGDPDFGCDFRFEVSGDRGTPQRTLRFGVPALGSNIVTELSEHNLYDFSKTMDLERAGNRAHTVGAGYTDTRQNASSISNGDLLMDVVAQRTDLSDHTAIEQFTKDLRRRAQPWVSTYTAVYRPNDAGGLPFDLCQVGDAMFIRYRTTEDHFLRTGPGFARVVARDWTPPAGGLGEFVALTFNIPLDELGA